MPNLERLHKMAHQKGAKTVALTIPSLQNTVKHWNRRQIGVNQKLRAFADASDGEVFLAELELTPQLSPDMMTKEQQSEIWDDNIHFTPKGYDVFGDIVFSSIEKYLASVNSND
jgi:lysophospholipase L1-like esterase